MSNSEYIEKIYIKNLLFISKYLRKFKPFVFYGTLLGITRENGFIKNDDDIDFLVDIKSKDQLLRKIKKLDKFKINEKIKSKYFLQLIYKENKLKFYTDFYFYTKKKNFIIDKHNWLSFIKSKAHHLHIPNNLIFPLNKSKKFKDVLIPNKKRGLCKFLYGKNWQIPRSKGTGYRIEIINNKPKIIERSKIGSLTRYIKSLIK
jgi:hypothetical protein